MNEHEILEDGATFLAELQASDRKRAAVRHAKLFGGAEIKEAGDGTMTITGIASTPRTDRLGDILEPLGATFELPLPFLLQHDGGNPIGQVTKVAATANGIEIVAKLLTGLSPRIDEACAMIRAGLYRGLSVGFQATKSEKIKGTGGQYHMAWELLEVSAVTIPANPDGMIAVAKNLTDATAHQTKPGKRLTVMR